MRWRWRVLAGLVFLMGGLAFGAGGGSGGAPKNLEVVLPQLVTVDAGKTTVGEFTDDLRKITQTNLVVNWNALAATGITRDTQMNLKLKDVAYEQVIRTLLEVLPATATRPNYIVGENTLEITTNAELGKGNVARIVSVLRVLTYTMDHPSTPEDQAENAKVIEKVLKAELVRAGEPLDGRAHSLAIRDTTMAVTLSERGQGIMKRAENMLNAPLRVGQLASGTAVTAAAKKGQETFNKIVGTGAGGAGKVPLETVARELKTYQGMMNVALLPGTAEELAKGKPELGYVINDGGVALIGPAELLRNRTVLAVYDLRDLIRRLNFKNNKKPAPTALEYQSAIVNVLHDTAKVEGDWGGVDDLGKKPLVMIPYNGLLIVFATPELQRTVAGGLSDMNK